MEVAPQWEEMCRVKRLEWLWPIWGESGGSEFLLHPLACISVSCLTRWKVIKQSSYSSPLSSDLHLSTPLLTGPLPFTPLFCQISLWPLLHILNLIPLFSLLHSAILHESISITTITRHDQLDFHLDLSLWCHENSLSPLILILIGRRGLQGTFDPTFLATDTAMLEKMSRRNRSLLSLSLTSLALTLSVSAFCTSYWCEGTHKVVKPLCLSPVKMKNCGQNNSQPYTTGESGMCWMIKFLLSCWFKHQIWQA